MLSRIYIYKKKERNKKIKLMKTKKDKKRKEIEQKKCTYVQLVLKKSKIYQWLNIEYIKKVK